MKYFFILFACLLLLPEYLLSQSLPDTITDEAIYFKYNNSSERDSIMKSGDFLKNHYNYSNQTYIKYIPVVSGLPMYRTGDENKFSFLFNDPNYSGKEKKKVAAIILKKSSVEQDLINEIRTITLDNNYKPIIASESFPIFPGGYNSLIHYLNEQVDANVIESNKEYLKEHSYLIICFTIRNDGSLNNVKIIDSCNKELDIKAYKMIKHMPKWDKLGRNFPDEVFTVMQLIFNNEL